MTPPNPLFTSPNATIIIAALLGHYVPPPPTPSSPNIPILDAIFKEIIHSLRPSLPLRPHIEAGTTAVTSLLDLLQNLPPATPPPPPSSYNPPNPVSHSPHSHPAPSSTLPAQHSAPFPPHTPAPTPALPTPVTVTQPAPAPGPTAPAKTHAAYPAATSAPLPQPLPTPSPLMDAPAIPHCSLSSARRPPRKKRYHDAVPSTHCHVCCRPSTAVAMAICSNIKEGTCRKVVCHRCVMENGWDWGDASKEGTRWICPHCTDCCTRVPRAQCWVYMRTNLRRKENRNKRFKSEGEERGIGGEGSGE